MKFPSHLQTFTPSTETSLPAHKYYISHPQNESCTSNNNKNIKFFPTPLKSNCPPFSAYSPRKRPNFGRNSRNLRRLSLIQTRTYARDRDTDRHVIKGRQKKKPRLTLSHPAHFPSPPPLHQPGRNKFHSFGEQEKKRTHSIAAECGKHTHLCSGEWGDVLWEGARAALRNRRGGELTRRDDDQHSVVVVAGDTPNCPSSIPSHRPNRTPNVAIYPAVRTKIYAQFTHIFRCANKKSVGNTASLLPTTTTRRRKKTQGMPPDCNEDVGSSTPRHQPRWGGGFTHNQPYTYQYTYVRAVRECENRSPHQNTDRP